MFASGPDFDITFGLAHTIEKSAEIYVKVLSMGGGLIRQTITDDDLRAIARDFGVTLNDELPRLSNSAIDKQLPRPQQCGRGSCLSMRGVIGLQAPSACSLRFSTSQPVSVTRTRSSTRTPNSPGR